MTNSLCSSPPDPALCPRGTESVAASAPRLSLTGNFAWAFAGNVTFAACQGANLVILAKAGDPSMVGRFALALAITAPLFLLTNLQLRSVQATDALGSYRFGHYLALRLLCTVAALSALPLIVLGAGYSWSFAAVVMAIGLGKSFDALNDVGYGLVQKHERLDRGGLARMIAGIGSLTGLALMIWLTGELLWGAVGWAAGHATATLLVRVWVGQEVLLSERPSESGSPLTALVPHWDWTRLRHLCWLALPMGVVMMLGSLQLNAPRYFIERYLDEKSLGVFAAMAYLMLVGNMVTLALGQAVTPRLAKHFAAAEFSSFFQILARLIALAVVGGILATALAAVGGRWLLSLLFTPQYAEYSTVLVCLAAVAGVEACTSYMGEAMTATRRFQLQMPVLLAALTAAAGACVWLIPRHGLIGAAAATGIGSATQLLGAAAVVAWAVHVRRKEAA